MLVLIRLLIVLAILPQFYATWLFKEDRACDPSRKNRLIPYTGYRLHRQYSFGRLPTLHHQRLTHCVAGSVDLEGFLPVDRNTDIQWGVNMCVGSSLCYRAVRRKKYANRDISLFVPRTVVGGLFQCPAYENCTNENAVPILPLISDVLGQQWLEIPRMRRIVQRVPYLYTPNFVDPRYPSRQVHKQNKWARALDIDEVYTYSQYEMVQIAQAHTKLLNTVHKILSVDPDILPWEVDAVIRDLQNDFRQPRRESLDLFKHYLVPIFKKLAPERVELVIKELQTPVDGLQLREPDIGHASSLYS